MKKERLLELAGVQLNESAKTVESVLKYFEHSGGDDEFKYYDIKEGYSASWKHESVVVIGISLDKKKYTIHTEERGELAATEDAVANLTVYKLTEVY